MRLLYRGSEDGFEARAFHKYCDDYEDTVTVIKVKENEHIIGGYTKGPFSSTQTVEIYESFLFSLTK